MSTYPMVNDCPRTGPLCHATRPIRTSRATTAAPPSQSVGIVFPRICITSLLLPASSPHAKSLTQLYLTIPNTAWFPSSLFPYPSSLFLFHRLLVSRSHTSPRDVPTSSHASNSLRRYVSVPSNTWVVTAHSPRRPRSGLTCTVVHSMVSCVDGA